MTSKSSMLCTAFAFLTATTATVAHAGMCGLATPYYCPSVNYCYSAQVYVDCVYSPMSDVIPSTGSRGSNHDDDTTPRTSSGGSGGSSAPQYADCNMDEEPTDAGGLKCKLTATRLTVAWSGSASSRDVENGKDCESKLTDKAREGFDARFESCDMDIQETSSGGESCKYLCQGAKTVAWSGSASAHDIENGKDCEGKLSDKARESIDNRYESCDMDVQETSSGGETCKYSCTSKAAAIWSGSVSKRNVEEKGLSCDDVKPQSFKKACGEDL